MACAQMGTLAVKIGVVITTVVRQKMVCAALMMRTVAAQATYAAMTTNTAALKAIHATSTLVSA